ncbi:1-(5-phosphoribosyl)-5-amino-4-imidazole- carboxylate (AIR) carboxylase [Coriobacterium glomerans PW2]|uniref:1-(5-phosphoribosyl)-5-amino-4-imidazole-carboxylate (AIR) carboxylase n=1 Tax=Coriobacterium glomerans (strain ATCC 49209 / DSM 20642 / JCM 10262 / PW2) TaxID=700015 RepID=F2N700_CORGP|nr:nickel pincer cofactor biosynthesis protein LarB [Coriobacterium glomerans]AEB06339.1 1-(5-phosphoribosyl)-5-amino-4-imidazole- carboxylate (AIR) carboxylase [Coriobacterium glomerans PW2]
MDAIDLERIARAVAEGDLTPADLIEHLRVESVSDLGYAQVDNERGVRTGVSEIIYGEGKTPSQIAGIVAAMRDAGQRRALITRLDAEKASSLQVLGVDIAYHERARAAVSGPLPDADGNGEILVLTAGTSDLAVADEAVLTARFLGNRVTCVHDVGVAGIHRLLSHARQISHAQVIIAIAGMEGALPSVVAGLASCPVIAVPTSVGYGASFGGIAALLGMLNSCSSGISVVNIDNGFGAAYQASLINHLKAREHDI